MAKKKNTLKVIPENGLLFNLAETAGTIAGELNVVKDKVAAVACNVVKAVKEKVQGLLGN